MAKMVDYEALKDFIEGEISNIDRFSTDHAHAVGDNYIAEEILRDASLQIDALESVLEKMKELINTDKG